MRRPSGPPSTVFLATIHCPLSQRINGSPGRKVEKRAALRALADEIGDEELRRIAADYVFIQSEKTGVGYIDDQPLAVYLDMHSAACKPADRRTLANSLASFATEALGDGIENCVVASPHEGNVIVTSTVAELLGLDFLMIRTGRAPRFGYPVEGVFLPGTSVILMDDLCMEASFLTRCVRSLRAYGINVAHCVCLFERLDGDAREGLAGVGVELHAKYQIDDDILRELKRSGQLVRTPSDERPPANKHRGENGSI